VAGHGDSIHGELRKPSTAAAETSRMAAHLHKKSRRSSVRKKRKIGANWRQGGELKLVDLIGIEPMTSSMP